jgi:hypothetical protein
MDRLIQCIIQMQLITNPQNKRPLLILCLPCHRILFFKSPTNGQISGPRVGLFRHRPPAGDKHTRGVDDELTNPHIWAVARSALSTAAAHPTPIQVPPSRGLVVAVVSPRLIVVPHDAQCNRRQRRVPVGRAPEGEKARRTASRQSPGLSPCLPHSRHRHGGLLLAQIKKNVLKSIFFFQLAPSGSFKHGHTFLSEIK